MELFYFVNNMFKIAIVFNVCVLVMCSLIAAFRRRIVQSANFFKLLPCLLCSCRGLRLSATDPLLGPCFRSKRIYRVASPSTTHVPKLLPLSAKSVFLKKSSFFGEVHNETKLPNAVSGTASKGVSGSTVLKPTAVQSSHENSKETPDIRPVSGTPQNSATPWFPTTQTTFSGSLLNENDKINKKDDLSLQQQSLTELLNAESINLNYDSVAQDIVTRYNVKCCISVKYKTEAAQVVSLRPTDERGRCRDCYFRSHQPIAQKL